MIKPFRRLDAINADYSRIGISEGIDPLKSNSSKECMICHYWFLKFQNSVCSGCHDLTMLSVNISNIAIITIKNVDYCCIIHNISTSEVIKFVKNSVLEVCGYIYKNIVLNFSLFKAIFVYFFCFAVYKIVDSMDMFKSLIAGIGTVMKNLEMSKFVPDQNLKNV